MEIDAVIVRHGLGGNDGRTRDVKFDGKHNTRVVEHGSHANEAANEMSLLADGAIARAIDARLTPGERTEKSFRLTEAYRLLQNAGVDVDQGAGADGLAGAVGAQCRSRFHEHTRRFLEGRRSPTPRLAVPKSAEEVARSVLLIIANGAHRVETTILRTALEYVYARAADITPSIKRRAGKLHRSYSFAAQPSV
jgi:hypothetical protein